jgi:4a-hydroxytetrahydrobiopterin dehydratase
MQLISNDTLQTHLTSDLSNWTLLDSGEISTVIPTSNFNHSMAIAQGISEIADTLNHHPDLLIRYKSVTVTIMTHDAKGITALDISFAQRVNALT